MPSEAPQHCPLCGANADEWVRDGQHDAYYCGCPNCGSFIATRMALQNLKSEADLRSQRYLLSGLSRATHDAGGRLTIEAENMRQLIASHSAPPNPMAAIDRLIEYISYHQADAAAYVPVNAGGAIITAKSPQEFSFLTKVAGDLELVEKRSEKNEYRLTIKGWQRASEVGRHIRSGIQAFVAMSFAPELDPAWEDGFLPALKSCGYSPIRIDLVHHNGKICDRILAEIRNSSLLVADFTGNRGGVYFEAGFGLGLRLPVVWTCRESDIGIVHFDTRQYNHVVWADPSDLRAKLTDRLRATALPA